MTSAPTDSKAFWSLAKAVGFYFVFTSFPPLACEDITIAASSKEKADHFAGMFAAESTVDPRGKSSPTIPCVGTLKPDIRFSQKIIRRVLKCINVYKATRPDNIPAVDLKKCAPELTAVLCRLFNLSYKTGIFTQSWKSARVQAIQRKREEDAAK